MTENYSFSKEQRLGIYEIIENVYRSHERRIRDLERMVDLLRHDFDRTKGEQFVSPMSENIFRFSDWVRDYYLPTKHHQPWPYRERHEPKPDSLTKTIEQILQFVKKNPKVTTSTLICKLELEPNLVNRALSYLEKEGKIRGETV
jgi:hypothetical protein